MIKLSKKQINSIAQDLDLGMDCYVHKETGEAITIPSNLDEFDDVESWKEELKNVKKNRDQYILIEKMDSSDSFKIMRRFMGKIANPSIRNKLMISISQNKPFQRFRDILDYNGDVLEDWYQFKQDEIERYVKRILDTFDEEEK